MKKDLFNIGLVFVVFSAMTSLAVAAQQSWQKIAPVGESFSVLMPDKAKEATRLIPLNEKDRIPERVYSSAADGKRYLVMSFLKTSPDRLLALSSFDNFLSGIGQAFKSSEEGLRKSLVFDREVSTENYTARQYHIKVGDYPGVARFLETEKAFYGLMVIGAEEGDTEALRFLSSFRLGEANSNSAASGIIVAIPIDFGNGSTSATNGSADSSPPEPWPRTAAPISGGVLNGKAINLPAPKYPRDARDARESGTVEVRIVIDEQGNVIRAEAISGPMTLRDASVAAALKARFTPTKLMGQPVKITGRIVYNFVAL
jgi:TonB family protein